MENALALIQFLTKQNPTYVQKWLQEAWEGTRTLPTNFNWKQLAMALEVLAKQDRETNNLEPDREWAKVAASLFEYLSNTVDDDEKQFFQERLIELKAYCIAHLGVIEGDPLLDAQQIVRWFKINTPFTLEEVEKKVLSESFKDSDFVEISRLLRLKKWLLWLQWLWDRGRLPHDDDLGRWLAIRRNLP